MMLKKLIFLVLISSSYLCAQNLEPKMYYPDTLFSSNDSVYFTSPQWDQVMGMRITNNDSIDWGTYGYRGVYFDLWTDLDTVRIPHVNHPYQQHITIPVASDIDTVEVILSFQSTTGADFSDAYTNLNDNDISIVNPMVYELANIILFLSECSKLTYNRPESDYANRVSTYFEPFKDHPLIKILSKKCENDRWSTYYGFRENAICYTIEENFLEYSIPYKHVRGDNSGIMGGNFRNMLYLVQDFMNMSDFEQFYESNKLYYEEQEDRLSDLLPLQRMWDWLESEFPQKMNSYKVFFSPLIGGSHSTQKFIRGFFGSPEYTECVMFINSAESMDKNAKYSESLKEGLMSGIVFTEIDHNYVNPTSKEHIEAIKELMSDKDFWATKEAQNNYRSEFAIFNEYMTHSLFCFYVSEFYDEEVAEQIIQKRIALMERRGYPRFQEFNKRLIAIVESEKKSVYELYPILIEEMKKIN